MLKSALLDTIPTEMRRYDLSHFQDEWAAKTKYERR